ncbi:MAG TPA: ABC transporter permease [Lacunisphaera sp.]|jgi:lipoprotein-releasing system permease protein
MPWPLYLALKQLFPSGRISLFTIIATTGIMLGVTIMLMVTSIMGGFGYQIGRMIVDTQGDIQVTASTPIDGNKAAQIEKVLASTPEVLASAPYAAGKVMIEYHKHADIPNIQGFSVEQMKKVLPLERYIIAGSLEDLDDDSVILSSILARSIGADVGSMISVYSPLMMERITQNEILYPREVRVAGIFQIGHQQLDSSTVLCSLRLMQDLYGLNHQVHGYNVRLKPGADVDVVAARLEQTLPPGVRAATWRETNAEFQSIVTFEANMIFFLMTFIILVAAFSITSSLLMSVIRKTREIGLLGAMGGRAKDVALCFCVQGLFLGTAGTALGLALGFTMLHFRDNIVHFIARISVGEETFVKFYQFSSLPEHTVAKNVVTIIVFSLVASTLAGLIPAWRAARLKPVEALRSE